MLGEGGHATLCLLKTVGDNQITLWAQSVAKNRECKQVVVLTLAETFAHNE